MRFDLTNPFSREPAVLAGLPRIVRLYMMHGLVGSGLAGVFTGLVLGLEAAGSGHFTTVQSDWLAALVTFTLSGIVFAGAQTKIGSDASGRRQGAPIPVRVRAD